MFKKHNVGGITEKKRKKYIYAILVISLVSSLFMTKTSQAEEVTDTYHWSSIYDYWDKAPEYNSNINTSATEMYLKGDNIGSSGAVQFTFDKTFSNIRGAVLHFKSPTADLTSGTNLSIGVIKDGFETSITLDNNRLTNLNNIPDQKLIAEVPVTINGGGHADYLGPDYVGFFTYRVDVSQLFLSSIIEAGDQLKITFYIKSLINSYKISLYDFELVITSYNNEAPVLTLPATTFNVDEEEELTFTATATDDSSNSLSFSLVDAPEGALINGTSGIFKWTPTEQQGGTTTAGKSHTFKVKVSDGEAYDEESITVNDKSVAPVLDIIDPIIQNEGTTVTFTAHAVDHDIPVETVSYSLSNEPDNATINASTGVFS